MVWGMATHSQIPAHHRVVGPILQPHVDRRRALLEGTLAGVGLDKGPAHLRVSLARACLELRCIGGFGHRQCGLLAVLL